MSTLRGSGLETLSFLRSFLSLLAAFFRFAAQRPLSIFRSSLSAGRAAALAAIALLPAAAAWAQPVDERLMTTVAGGASGDGGAAIQARLRDPYGVAVDGSGNLYIADTDNHRIRKVDAGTGNISTVAGDGTGDFGGDGGAATAAQLEEPFDVVVDGSGNLYIADRDNDRIRKVDASTGNISTIAGGGTNSTGTGIPAVQARLRDPYGVAVDGSGNVYIADGGRRRIRKVDTSGTITTVAGTGNYGDGGPAVQATLHFPHGMVVDGSGNLYIADTDNHRIRKVDADTGNISTVAGTGAAGYSGDNGAATAAQLNFPDDVAGNLYIADRDNHRIRKVDPSGTITTVAGTGQSGYGGDGTAADAAQLDFPYRLAADAAGNLYVADAANHRIRRIGLPPTATLSANPETIVRGRPSTLTWSSTNAVSAEIDQGVGAVAPAAGGSTTVSPTATTTYTLTVTDANGAQAAASATISVSEPQTPIDTVGGDGTAGYGGPSAIQLSLRRGRRH